MKNDMIFGMFSSGSNPLDLTYFSFNSTHFSSISIPFYSTATFASHPPVLRILDDLLQLLHFRFRVNGHFPPHHLHRLRGRRWLQQLLLHFHDIVGTNHLQTSACSLWNRQFWSVLLNELFVCRIVSYHLLYFFISLVFSTLSSESEIKIYFSTHLM